MFTHSYKSGWIHGYLDKAECSYQYQDAQGNYLMGKAKSYRAAQLAITKALKDI